MPRALTVARVTVPPANEREYLAAAADLAGALARRGQHFWLFRHSTIAGQFLEFCEAGDAASHLATAPTPVEELLIGALRRLASEEEGGNELWLEVPPPSAASPADHSR